MKQIHISVLTIFTVALTACGTSSSNTQTGLTQTNDGFPTETQLALGSLKLEETDYAITVEQAEELLPMWQVYDELMNSDTVAQEEIDALTEQIEETMTSEQMQAIADMQLNQQDILTALQTSTVGTNSSQSNTSVTTPNNGGMSTGGPPDGGGVPPDMVGGMPADFGGAVPATGQTQNTQTNSNVQRVSGVPTALVQALIQSLEQKIAV